MVDASRQKKFGTAVDSHLAVPEADAWEQSQPWGQEDEGPPQLRIPPEVPKEDAIDQSRPAPFDDERLGW